MSQDDRRAQRGHPREGRSAWQVTAGTDEGGDLVQDVGTKTSKNSPAHGTQRAAGRTLSMNDTARPRRETAGQSGHNDRQPLQRGTRLERPHDRREAARGQAEEDAADEESKAGRIRLADER